MAFYIKLQDITLCVLLFAVIFLWRIISSHARSNKSDSRPPEPAGAWPFIGHLHLLGANRILHHTLGAMADKYGPIFSLQLGIHKTIVVSSWEVAKECFTTHDKVFPTRPKSLAGKLMGYDHSVFLFLAYGPYWRDIRKLSIVELLSTRRLDVLKHVRESEVNSFVRELYEQGISNGGGGSKAVVDMKERFGDLALNIVVRMVAGKHYFGTQVYHDEEARRFQKAMADYNHLVGLSMVSDAVPLFGWIDALRGYKGKMKKTAKEIDHVLGSWMKEHRQKRKTLSIKESEQNFIHVMLSVMDGSQFTEHDTDKAIKGTCLLQDITVLLGLLFAVICLWKIISTHARSNKRNSRPPEPAGAWPFIGHLHLLGANKILHHTFGAMADKYGPIFSLQMGIHRTLVVSSWEVAKECFTTHDKVFLNRPKSLAVKLMAYDHAFFSFMPYGPYWRDIRKLATVGLLSTHRLHILKHVRESEVNIFVRELYEQWISNGGGSKAVVEMKERFGDLTMNIVVRMVAGKRYFGTGVYGDEESRQCQKAMGDFMHLLGLFMVSDAVPLFGWIDALKGHKGEMKKTAKEIDRVLGGWVKEHRQKRESQSINETDQDFIHVMLSVINGGQFAEHDTDTAIKATCLSLILGGYETTTVTLTWALSLLLNNRHVLQKAQDELDFQVGRNRQVNESDVKNLTYLQAIVKETLRLYPAAQLSGPRQAIEDCSLAGFHIPAGTRLLVNLWKLQRDPSIWSNPLEFQPERFLQKHVDVGIWGQDFELIPFGSGRRACPGITFAVQVLHLTLARLLHGFELGTVSDSPIDMTESAGISNPKATPLEVTLTPRLPAMFYD